MFRCSSFCGRFSWFRRSPCGLSGHVYSWCRLLIGSFNANEIGSPQRWAGVSVVNWERPSSHALYPVLASEKLVSSQSLITYYLHQNTRAKEKQRRWDAGDAYLSVSGPVESCLALSESRTKRLAWSCPLAVLSKRQIKMHLCVWIEFEWTRETLLQLNERCLFPWFICIVCLFLVMATLIGLKSRIWKKELLIIHFKKMLRTFKDS